MLAISSSSVGCRNIVLLLSFQRCCNFLRNKGFDYFPCVLNVIPISFETFIILSLFTFLHKVGELTSIFLELL